MPNNVEIERKFLVDAEKLFDMYDYKKLECLLISQFYFSVNPCIRLRLQKKANTDDSLEYIYTYKGPGLLSRTEIEVSLSKKDFDAFDTYHLPSVIKNRYLVPYAGKMWEVDQFVRCSKYDAMHENESGPILQIFKNRFHLAEIELSSEDEAFEIPPFCTREVTEDKQYSNVNLAINLSR